MRSILISLFSVFIAFFAFNCNAKNVAIIIGVSEFSTYNDKPGDMDLPDVYNDARLVCSTLSHLSTEEFVIYRVFALRKNVPNWDQDVDDLKKIEVNNQEQYVNYFPTKKNILTNIQQALENVTEEDSVVIYISSHGCVASREDETGKIFACDTNSDDPSTFIQPKSEIRQTLLKNCKAKYKLLILDTCGAGGTRGKLVAKCHPEVLSDGIPNMITLASCGVTQKSEVWSDKSMSLFTYWLVSGLKGYADGFDSSPTDGFITTKELQEYIKANILLLGVNQNPVTIQENDTKPFNIIKPQFKDPESALDDLAEQIVVQLQMRGETIVNFGQVVLSKYDTTSNTPEYNSALSYWVKHCSDELYRRVSDKCKHCKPEPIQITRLDKVSSDSAQISMILHHVLDRNDPENIQDYELQCCLDTKSVTSDMNVRFRMPREDLQIVSTSYRETPAQSSNTSSSHQYKMVNSLECTSNSGEMVEISFRVYNPATDEYVVRPIYLIDNVPYLPLSPGEKYRIYVNNKTSNSIMGRILVDGRNTLPQIQRTTKSTPDITWSAWEIPSKEGGQTSTPKLMIVSTENKVPKNKVREPEVKTRIGNARAWEFEANKTSKILGFFKPDQQGKGVSGYNEFVVSSVSNDVNPDKYRNDMGLITIVLYSIYNPKLDPDNIRTRNLKTVDGEFYELQLESSDAKVGPQFYSTQVRYVTQDSIKQFTKAPGTMRNISQ